MEGQLRRSRRANDFPYYLELPSPSLTQMRSTVKGHDRYVPRARFGLGSLALALALLVGAAWGIALLVLS